MAEGVRQPAAGTEGLRPVVLARADVPAGGLVLPVYLGAGADAFPAFVHEPAAAAATGLGVVLCPPFGWEDMSSYRPRRTWAERLVADGHVALRLDLPGSGDAAGGPHEPGRLNAWLDAIAAAAAHLRLARGCRRVVAIGIGSGGMLALASAAQREAPIDDFVLWGAVARGRALLRAVSLFSRMEVQKREAEGGPEAGEDGLEPGALAVGGYVLSAETASALKALDLRSPAFPESPARRALVLEQDGISADGDLVGGLRAAGVDVTVAAGGGYGKMMLEPQFSRSPEETIAAVSRWLGAEPVRDGVPVALPAPPVADELVLPGGVRERFVALPHPDGDMVAVLTDPADAKVPVRALLLGGTGHRIGPNRMWVEAARRWAARGVPCVRLDVTGVGDAAGTPPPDVPALYRAVYVGQVRHAIAALVAESQRSAVTVGLCAAAYWVVHAALEAERRVMALVVNPGALHWSPDDHHERMRRHYRQMLFRRETWRRLLGGEVSLVNAPRAFLAGVLAVARRPAARVRALLGGGSTPAAPPPPGTVRVMDQLHERGVPAHLVFAGREPLLHDLRRDGVLDAIERWPGLTVEVVPGEADVHTLRPVWLQREVHAMLDAALDAELQRVGASPAVGAGA